MKRLLKRERSKVETGVDERIEEFLNQVKTPEDLEKVISLVKGRNEMGVKSQGVKADTWVLAGTNLAGLLLILNYEKVNVITTKALGFIVRGGRA